MRTYDFQRVFRCFMKVSLGIASRLAIRVARRVQNARNGGSQETTSLDDGWSRERGETYAAPQLIRHQLPTKCLMYTTGREGFQVGNEPLSRQHDNVREWRRRAFLWHVSAPLTLKRRIHPDKKRRDVCATREGASDPSPGPLRLMKTPAAVHPLPKGEGCLIQLYSVPFWA
jgi:hypothetical protein